MYFQSIICYKISLFAPSLSLSVLSIIEDSDNLLLIVNIFYSSFSIMSAALPTVSFFCVVLLSIFAAGPRIRTDFSQLVLVLWLIVCNFIQGINSLVWAGNTDIHIPGWCDLGKAISAIVRPCSQFFTSDQYTFGTCGCHSWCMHLHSYEIGPRAQ